MVVDGLRLTFSADELALARIVAHVRESSHNGATRWKIPMPEGADSLETNYVGAAGELAVHWLTRLPWTTFVQKPSGVLRDVGLLEVRTRMGHEDPVLWVRTGDAGATAVVLVTWEEPVAWIRGWIMAGAVREAGGHMKGPTGDVGVRGEGLMGLGALPERQWPRRFRA